MSEAAHVSDAVTAITRAPARRKVSLLLIDIDHADEPLLTAKIAMVIEQHREQINPLSRSAVVAFETRP